MKTSVTVIDKIQYIQAETKSGLKVVFSSLGASIFSIHFNGEIMSENPASTKDFLKPNIYHGKTIGQIANRVKDGKVIINDVTYQITPNEGPTALHGGPGGLSQHCFGIQRFQKDGNLTIIYSHEKPKKGGYLPGKVNYLVAYTLSDDSTSIRVDYRASSDEDTIIALTNHTFFCLGDENIDDLKMMIPSHRFIHPDESLLIPVEERDIVPCLDFNKKKPLIKDIDDPYLLNSRTKGYDHSFILDKNTLLLDNNKYSLEVETNFKTVQIYTDNYSDGVKMSNSPYELRRGVAIEPQDSLLNREVIKKRTPYERYIIYTFKKK